MVKNEASRKRMKNVFGKTRLIITSVGCFSGMMGTEMNFKEWTQQVFKSF